MTVDFPEQPAFPLPSAIEIAFEQSSLKDYSESELAALLGVSPRWLQYQRERGLPPPFYNPNRSNLVRYPHDALMVWKRGEVARSMAEAKAAYDGRKPVNSPRQSSLSKRDKSAHHHVMGVRLGSAEIHGLDEPRVRGGRPRKVPATFAEFLGSTNPDSEWLFSLRGVVQRPIDFLGMMVSGVAHPANDTLVWLPLLGWIKAMEMALHHEAEQQRAAIRAAALAARPASVKPGKGRA